MPDPTPVSPSAVDRDNPWPGLASFTEDSRSFFFGREKETDELSRLVRRQTLTVLFGQSGLGKSSLLQAGLFPLLRESDFLPLYLRLDHSPGSSALAEQVRSALTAAFAAAGADAPAFRAGETLWEYFHRKDVDIWSAKNRLLTPVLTFDQFEEIFTLGRADEASRERSGVFLAELACLVENRAPAAVQERLDRGELDPAGFNFQKPSCQVILSLREDFLPDLEGIRQQMPALVHNRLRLKKLSGLQALEIVTKPAPHLLAEGVAERIVEFVAGARGGSTERLAELDVEPPLLSVICRALNERRRALGQAQITADLVSGNRREILTDFYERSVADLPDGMRAFVEDHLLTKSGFRDNLALETALEYPDVTRPLIDTLVARRLLRLEDRLGVQRVELTHDVLAEVIRAARDARQQRLAVLAAEHRSRRQRWAIAGLAVAVAALLVGAFFGLRTQRSSAAQASQTDLVLGSRLLDEGKLAEGIAYLVRAGRKDTANPLVAPRLLSALSTRTFLLPDAAPLALPSPAIDAGYTSDGRWVAFQGEDGLVRLVDAHTWQMAREYDFGQKVRPHGVRGAEKNPAILAVVLKDDTLMVVDVATGRPRVKPIRPPARISGGNSWVNFKLSPDGHWLAAGGAGQVWLWDTATGELYATLSVNDYYSDSSFSPDSRKIVVTRDRQTRMWSIPDRTYVGTGVESAGGSWAYGEFSADGRRLMVRNGDGVIIADAATGAVVRPLTPITSYQTGIQLSGDGNKLIQAPPTRTVEVMDLATGKPAYPPLIHGGNVRGSWQVDNGRVLVTNSIDGSVRFWDLATGKPLAEPTLRQSNFAPAAPSPDGKSVAVFTAGGQAYRFHVGNRPAAPLSLPRERTTTQFLNLHPDLPARLQWVTHTEIKTVDIAAGRETTGSVVFPEPVSEARRSTYGSTLGPGDVFIVRTQNGLVRIWTLGKNTVARNVPLSDPPGEGIQLTTIAIDSFGQRLASPLDGGPKARLLGIWDSQTGRRVAVIDAGTPIRSTNYAGFSPDGKRVIFQNLDGGAVQVRDVSTGKLAFTLELTGKANIRTWRYSATGKRILTGDSWGGIHVWDAATGELMRSTQYHRTSIAKFEFSPDLKYYASVSTEGSVQVWDAATDLPVGDLLEQSGGATRAEFSPDSTRIATPASSGSARVWDVKTGLPVTDAYSSDGDPTSVVAITGDGRFMEVHGGANATKQHIRVWAVPPPSTGRTPEWLLTLATICAGHRLTDAGKLHGALDEMVKMEDVKRALAAAPADDPYAEWGRWILSDSPTRSIGPGFTVTPAEAAKLKAEWLKP